MPQTREDAKVGGWFAGRYSCVSMDRALNAKFLQRLSLCLHGDTCPGCPLLDLSYPEQLTHKFELVRSELSAYPELAELQLMKTQPAPSPFAYRTRAKLVASGVKLGLYARGTHDLLDIPQCRVLDARLAAVLAALRALLPSEPLLAGVDVARAGEQLLVTLIAREDADERALDALAARLCERCPEVAGVSATRRADDAVQLLASGHTLLRGEGQVRVSHVAGGPYHYVAFGAFMQAHQEVAGQIYAALEERVFAAGPVRPRVLELFAGSGALSLALAARGADVVAIESYGPACGRLLEAANEQGLALRVIEGDAGEQLRLLQREGAGFDVVLVNPPRRGLRPELRGRIAALGPALLGYVSCRPSTLARDLAHFARLGLVTESAAPFDMMPMTSQVETLAWLKPGADSPLQVCAQQPDFIVVDKPPFVTSEALAAQVRRIAGYEHALPCLELSAQASGLVPFVASAAQLDAVSALTRARSFTVLARGVLRPRGRLRGQGGGEVRYVRERVVAGHSLLRVLAADERSVRRALRAIAHPVLGDASSDRESARYFALRHGLDRCFLHLGQFPDARPGGDGDAQGRADLSAVSAPLAPDLGAVLRSLESRTAASDALAGA
jgi:23S rRNA (uracil1939-C5)-methyltransferase